MNDKKTEYYERRLLQMLSVAGVARSACYRPADVQAVLNINPVTFGSLCDNWEPPGMRGRKPGGLESYMINSHRRVPHHALVEWLAENATFERQRAADSGGVL